MRVYLLLVGELSEGAYVESVNASMQGAKAAMQKLVDEERYSCPSAEHPFVWDEDRRGFKSGVTWVRIASRKVEP